nr:hypothetical protein [Limibacillus halophilus]
MAFAGAAAVANLVGAVVVAIATAFAGTDRNPCAAATAFQEPCEQGRAIGNARRGLARAARFEAALDRLKSLRLDDHRDGKGDPFLTWFFLLAATVEPVEEVFAPVGRVAQGFMHLLDAETRTFSCLETPGA